MLLRQSEYDDFHVDDGSHSNQSPRPQKATTVLLLTAIVLLASNLCYMASNHSHINSTTAATNANKPVVTTGGTEIPEANSIPLPSPPSPSPPSPPPESPAPAVGPEDESDHTSRQRVFETIYDTHTWGMGTPSRSGSGSTVPYTQNTRSIIQHAIETYNFTALLDAPCGDCHWQPSIPAVMQRKVSYTGVDIVSSVILENAVKHMQHSNMRFAHMDLAIDSFPKDLFDLAICRDAVQHNPVAVGLKIYQTLEATGARFLMTNFYFETKSNDFDLNTASGTFIKVNPLLPPFNFSRPLMYIREGASEGNFAEGKAIGLFRLPALGQGDGTYFPIEEEKAKSQVVILE